MTSPHRQVTALRWIAASAAAAMAAFATALAGAATVVPAWLMAFAIPAAVHGFLTLQPDRPWGRIGRLVCAAALSLGFVAALLVPADAPRVLGIPLGTFAMAVLVGVVPLVILPAMYAAEYTTVDAGHAAELVDAPAPRAPGRPGEA